MTKSTPMHQEPVRKEMHKLGDQETPVRIHSQAKAQFHCSKLSIQKKQSTPKISCEKKSGFRREVKKISLEVWTGKQRYFSAFSGSVIWICFVKDTVNLNLSFKPVRNMTKTCSRHSFWQGDFKPIFLLPELAPSLRSRAFILAGVSAKSFPGELMPL